MAGEGPPSTTVPIAARKAADALNSQTKCNTMLRCCNAQHHAHLELEDLGSIARLHEAGQSIRQIAAAMDRSPSTVSRELKRNRRTRLGYKPAYTDSFAVVPTRVEPAR